MLKKILLLIVVSAVLMVVLVDKGIIRPRKVHSFHLEEE